MTDQESPKPKTQAVATPPSPQGNPGDVSPDSLMTDFRGSSLFKILLFTLILHVVVLIALSPGYLMKLVFGEQPEPVPEEVQQLSEEERLGKAEEEGKAAFREIADRYNVKFSDLKARLTDGTPAATPNTDTPADPAAGTGDAATGDGSTSGGDSQIEKDLNRTADGPSMPPGSPEDGEDLFDTP